MKIVRAAFFVMLLAASAASQRKGNEPPTTQSATSIDSHILWERRFENLKTIILDAAVTDTQQGLWIITDGLNPIRIVHIGPNGDLASADELPSLARPKPPAEHVCFHLAVSPSGKTGVLAHYSHTVGRAVSFDGAKFGLLGEDGKLGALKNVAGPGPEYKGFVALSDEHFLVMGDQSPLIIMSVNPQGDVIWRRTFPPSWVLPSGAPLENGASCVLSSAYASPQLRLIRLDGVGAVRHRAGISARRGEAVAGPEGTCAVLYDREPKLLRGEFYLTSFDSSFRRRWTTPVTFSAPQGGLFHLLALRDGYLVAAEERNRSLFLAKYDYSGQLVWSVLDPSRQAPDVVAATADGFYLVGAKREGDKCLNVLRGR